MRDPRELDPLERYRAARRIQEASDVDLPAIPFFNSSPCARHKLNGGLSQSCEACGIELRRHQRIGAAWLYARPRAFLADSVGTGKTPQIAWLLAAMKASGELSLRSRAIVICKASAVGQWAAQLRRMLPRVLVTAAEGSAKQRVAAYLDPWEVVVVSDRTFTPKRGAQIKTPGDITYLDNFPVHTLVFDDIDAMRNHRNKTANAIKRMCGQVERVIGVHGTPAQKRIVELHSYLEPIGANEVLGPLPAFRARFVKEGATYFYQVGMVCPRDHLNPAGKYRCQYRDRDDELCDLPLRRDPTGRKVKRSVVTDIGVKNPEEFRYLVDPYVMRRKAEDCDDAALPALQRNIVYLEPTPRQRERYKELRAGTLRRVRELGDEITLTEAAAAFTRGQQICSSLANLDVGRDDSAKLDWVTDKLDGGDLSEEKVIVFCYFKPTVQALSDRLKSAGIGHVLFWGAEQGHAERQRRLERFRTDPECRVLVGTTSIEQSLNLQAARHLVCVDTIMNPSRMEQLAGRIRRQGSAFGTVYVHLLWLLDTQEDKYLMALEGESAAISAAWGETENDLWGKALTPAQMARMVAGI